MIIVVYKKMKCSFFGWRTHLKLDSHRQPTVLRLIPIPPQPIAFFSARSFFFDAKSCETNRNQWDSRNRPWIVPNKHLNRWFHMGFRVAVQTEIYFVPPPLRYPSASPCISSKVIRIDTPNLQPNPLSECPSHANKSYAIRGRTSHCLPCLSSDSVRLNVCTVAVLPRVSNVCYIQNRQIFRHLSSSVSRRTK